MTTQEVAQQFAALCKEGKFHEAGAAFWSDDIVSIEPMAPGGGDPVSRGRAAVDAKGEWWYANHEIHRTETQGPYIAPDHFALRFTIEVTPKAAGQRMTLDEIGLYTVRDGKVVEERFLYGGMG